MKVKPILWYITVILHLVITYIVQKSNDKSVQIVKEVSRRKSEALLYGKNRSMLL